WDDLQRSGQFISLMTMGAQLEKQTGLRLDANYIRELLDAPMEISLWDAFEKDQTTRFVIIMEVEPKYQSLIKLAEVYAQTIEKSTVIEQDNMKIIKTEWLDNTLFHLVKNKQLIVSNNLDVFLQVMRTASKDGTVHPFRNSEFFRDFHDTKEGNFKCRFDLSAYLKNIIDFLGKKSLQLAINMDLDKIVNIYSLYLVSDPPISTPGLCALDESKEFIPREPAMAATALYDTQHYLQIIQDSAYFMEINETLNLDLEKEIIPFFNERFFFYLMNFQDTGNPNILNGVVGLYLNKCSPDQLEKIVSFVKALMSKPGQEMSVEKEKQKNGLDIYRFSDPAKPAFCVTNDCILLGTGYESLKESLLVYRKKSPSLSDGKAYQALGKEFSAKCFSQILVNPAQLFKSLANHLQFVGNSAGDFTVADVKLKILPVIDIVSQIPNFGIFWLYNKKALAGKVRFVEQKSE
ncbi:MAG TPA: hypothetical protein VK186_21705, partial [Candidatus Deferrimicrobium sp.]|nr:hypothetical protein [Candidatus Deferrimicrobium sp.]